MTANGTPSTGGSDEPIAVLHVDDDPQVTELTRRRLESNGDRFEVTEANDPATALDLFESKRFECVLSDYRMPGTDGIELLEAVRERDAHLPFILFTGRGSESVASEALAAGATDYVTKGRAAETYETLANRIENAVTTDRVRAALEESERRFREVTETIEEVVWLADGETGEPHYVNPAYEAVWGRPVDAFESNPTAFLDGVHPDDRDRVRTALESMTDGYREVYRVVRPDGAVRWVEDSGVPVRNADGTVERVVGVAKDITPYKEAVRERELLLERITDGFVSVDDADRLTYVNERAAAFLDADPESLLGRHLWDVIPDVTETEFYGAHREAVETGETRAIEARIEPLERWFQAHIYPSDDGVSTIFRDVTKRKRREQLLDRLTAVSEDVLRASTSLEIYDIAVAAATDVFERPEASCYALRPDENRLEPVASWTESAPQSRLDGDRAIVASAWRAFTEQRVRYEPAAGGESASDRHSAAGDDRYPARISEPADGREPTRADDPIVGADPAGTIESAPVSEGDRASAVFVPLGDHGVLAVFDPVEDAFSPVDVDLLELLGTLLAAALDRASGQSTIAERELALERVSDDVSRLELHAHVARETLRAVDRADTRPGLERSVCEFLTALDAFEAAWIGTYDPVEETVTPSTWRGVSDRYFERESALAARHRDLLDRAIETGAAQRVEDALDALEEPSARRDALRYGCRTVVAVPFGAEPVAGGLVCFGRSPGVFSDELVSVLAEVGATVGGAIRSIERSRALAAGTELAVELELSDSTGFYQSLARRAGGTVELQGATPSGDRLAQFVSIEATNADSAGAASVDSTGDGTLAETAVDDDAAWTASLESAPGTVEVLAAADGRALIRLETADETVFDPLRDAGGTLRSLSASPSGVTIRVHVPHGTDVRALVEAYRRRYESVDLRARRETDAGDDRSKLLRTAGLDRLTDRQREALLLAYHGGYFESPRETTGGDLAALMGVSSPTFHDHLRSAQARLFDAFLDPGAN